MTDHIAACEADQCPDCMSRNVRADGGWRECLDCQCNAPAHYFLPLECICDLLAASAAAEQAEADAEMIAGINHE